MNIRKKIKKIHKHFQEQYMQPFFRKMCGMDEIEEEISTAFYLLDRYVDITKFPKATGLLRDVQLVDTELLRIFDEICRKHGLTYWLDWGTLLGAVRHKGFIPWDDDLDVTMPRSDYDRVCEILKNALKGCDNIEIIDNADKRKVLTIWSGGANMDIFPMDCVSSNQIASRVELKDRIHKFRVEYSHKQNQYDVEYWKKRKIELIGDNNGEPLIWYYNPEFMSYTTIFDNATIFPLKRISFEGYSFFVPNNYELFLTEVYGNYMEFPHKGLLHHSGGNGEPMYENSIKFGTDMEALLASLQNMHFEEDC